MSLFAERQLIEIRIPSGKPGKDGAEALQAYCGRLPDDVLTLVQLPRLDWQQAKAAWFAALDAAGVTVRVESLERKALPAWLAQRLARQGQRVQAGEAGQRTLAFFADCVEGNLLAAHQEIQKLALLAPGRRAELRAGGGRGAQGRALRRHAAGRGGLDRPGGAHPAHGRRPAGRGRIRRARALGTGRGPAQPGTGARGARRRPAPAAGAEGGPRLGRQGEAVRTRAARAARGPAGRAGGRPRACATASPRA